ncbi:response regulator [Herbaspirillum sp. LeCh32-8]|uniref:response regulator transcription factor n=1 Tax=Herbaspirillum sp. LeCh32-8 TaxID=2821356 RepID=UPI001AE26417|nr:response regulator [Herbaspirillum sp. LeCh32-8]MBP0598062.1 response regulator [Herbaspirillum sp. LeCh32-8]
MSDGETMSTPPAGDWPVAVIDDNQGVRTALCNLLDSAGYRSCSFAAGEQFLRSDCLPAASCAIVDLDLTCMSGFDLAEQLAQLRPELPVILMSARDNALQRQRASELGAAALLFKPFDADTLLAQLRAIIAAPG